MVADNADRINAILAPISFVDRYQFAEYSDVLAVVEEARRILASGEEVVDSEHPVAVIEMVRWMQSPNGVVHSFCESLDLKEGESLDVEYYTIIGNLTKALT